MPCLIPRRYLLQFFKLKKHPIIKHIKVYVLNTGQITLITPPSCSVFWLLFGLLAQQIGIEELKGHLFGPVVQKQPLVKGKVAASLGEDAAHGGIARVHAVLVVLEVRHHAEGVCEGVRR